MKIIHEAFQKIILETPVTGALFYAMSGLATVLMLIEISRIYSSIILKQRVEPWEVIRPFAVVVLAISWKFIYAGLSNGFAALSDVFNAKLAQQFNKNGEEVITEMFRQISSDSSLSIIGLNVNSLFLSFLNFVLACLYWLVDAFVSLYVDINDFVLALFAPIAIVFSVMRETSKAFITWLMLFLKFRMFMLTITLTNYLALSLVNHLQTGLAESLDISQTMLSITGVANAITALTLAVFLIFKIIFLFMTWSFLSQLFQAGDLSAGSGSAQLVQQVKMVASRTFTKGAA